MTVLEWDAIDKRSYETGLDRGVLYPMEGGAIPWNGLLSLNETYDGGEITSYAENGITFLNSSNAKDYKATLKAFSAPRELNACLGDVEVKPGFILTKQPRKQFNFSYRTLIADIGYKIHIVYNALASPTSRSYETNNDTPTPVNLEWDISALPLSRANYRPTAHYIIDSTKVSAYAMSVFEDHLYGTLSTSPALPLPEEIEMYLSSVYTDPGVPGGTDIITEPITDFFEGTIGGGGGGPAPDTIADPIQSTL